MQIAKGLQQKLGSQIACCTDRFPWVLYATMTGETQWTVGTQAFTIAVCFSAAADNRYSLQKPSHKMISTVQEDRTQCIPVQSFKD